MPAVPTRSALPSHIPEAFWWATGIEDSFITAPWPATGRSLDEYDLTQHYERWKDDLALMRDLGVKVARYGIPWHRVQPEPNRWDWTFADAALDELLALEIDPIVDLVHYGLPPWLERAFLEPDYPERVADYAARLAERFRGRILWYTPLNEPRITAWYCGRLGWWPPFERGWRGFVRVMLAVCRGIVRTVEALRSVDPEIVPVHVDATDLYRTDEPSLHAETERRRQIVFLALDLVSGRVDSDHPLHAWLRANGASAADLDFFRERPLDLGLIGLNLYPMFTNKKLKRGKDGRLRIVLEPAGGELLEDVARLYHARYGAPLMVTETASMGSVARRRRWLGQSVASAARLRAEGVPLVGYTWWPMFSLVAWAYRQGRKPIADYIVHMGLWDLEPGPDGVLSRRPTPLVDEFRALASRGPPTLDALSSR